MISILLSPYPVDAAIAAHKYSPNSLIAKIPCPPHLYLTVKASLIVCYVINILSKLHIL